MLGRIKVNDDILSKSLSYFSGYIKFMFTSSYIFECNIYNCYVCEISNYIVFLPFVTLACILSTTCVNHQHQPHWQFLVFFILSYFSRFETILLFCTLFLESHLISTKSPHFHLPDVRCEFGKLNAKYQMHLRLRELAVPPNPPIYPLIDINDVILSKSLSYFSGYIKFMFTSSYIFECNIYKCYVCENSNYIVFLPFVTLACILSTTCVNHQHQPHWQFLVFFILSYF